MLSNESLLEAFRDESDKEQLVEGIQMVVFGAIKKTRGSVDKNDLQSVALLTLCELLHKRQQYLGVNKDRPLPRQWSTASIIKKMSSAVSHYIESEAAHKGRARDNHAKKRDISD